MGQSIALLTHTIHWNINWGVIRTLQHKADNISTSLQAQAREQKHLRGALKTCGYPSWTFEKNKTKHHIPKRQPTRGEKRKQTQKLRGIFNIHHIPSHCFQIQWHTQTETDTSQRLHTTNTEKHPCLCRTMQWTV